MHRRLFTLFLIFIISGLVAWPVLAQDFTELKDVEEEIASVTRYVEPERMDSINHAAQILASDDVQYPILMVFGFLTVIVTYMLGVIIISLSLQRQ